MSRGLLRASHADREHVVEVLKGAFVLGMLDKAELDVRVGQAFASRTYRDLAAITADLPADVIGARQPREPAPAETASAEPAPPVSKPLLWTAVVILLAGMVAIPAAFPAQSVLLMAAGVLAILIAAPLAGTLMLDLWREKHRGSVA